MTTTHLFFFIDYLIFYIVIWYTLIFTNFTCLPYLLSYASCSSVFWKISSFLYLLKLSKMYWAAVWWVCFVRLCLEVIACSCKFKNENGRSVGSFFLLASAVIRQWGCLANLLRTTWAQLLFRVASIANFRSKGIKVLPAIFPKLRASSLKIREILRVQSGHVKSTNRMPSVVTRKNYRVINNGCVVLGV